MHAFAVNAGPDRAPNARLDVTFPVSFQIATVVAGLDSACTNTAHTVHCTSTLVDVPNGVLSGDITGAFTEPGNFDIALTTSADDVDPNPANDATTAGAFVQYVDPDKPTITITTPKSGASYPRGATVPADYACHDEGAGLAVTDGCVGPVANGAPIDTASYGPQTFTVTAKDKAGNTVTESVHYDVVVVDASPPVLTLPTSPVTLDPTGADGASYGSATTGYPGVSATDDQTAHPAIACAPAAPHTFALGSDTTVSCTATDDAGRSATKTFVVHVRVTASTLCALTKQLVQGSSRYQALAAPKKSAVDKLVTAACQNLDGLVAGLTQPQKLTLIALYKKSVDVLASPAQGWLTTSQATMLNSLADALGSPRA
jgi:hypothetical protein